MEHFNRRTFIAASTGTAALALAGCKYTHIVAILYRPIVNFQALRFGDQPNQVIPALASRLSTLCEITQIDNLAKDGPFVFGSDQIVMKNGNQAFLQELLPNLILPIGYKDTVAAGTSQQYPKSTPILTGPWCQTRQHLRFIMSDNAFERDKADTMKKLDYAGSAIPRKVMMVRKAPLDTIPFFPEISVKQITDTFLKGTFFGTCGTGGGTSGGGSSGGETPPANQEFTFCVTGPGSGAQTKEIKVVATSYSAALEKLKKESLTNDGIGWNIVPGKCST